MKEKKCPQCNQFLPLSEFNKDKNRKDGLTSYCRKCIAKKSREYMSRWVDARLLSVDIECTKCHRFLQASSFNKRTRKKSGLSSICRDCDSKRNKDYREKIKREIEKGQRKIKIPKRKRCRKCNRILSSSKFTKDIVSVDGLNSYCKECDHKRQKEYQNKPSFKKKRNRYRKEYRKRPEVKLKEREYRRLYNRKPENKQKKKEYNRRPEVKFKKKEYMKKYLARPSVKEYRKKYLKEYNSRLEVKERRRKYLKDYKQQKTRSLL